MEKVYKSEEEFLKDYNAKDFDQLSMTADILLISVSSEDVDNYRKNSKKMMSILLVKRDDYPFKDKWCLPGGFLDSNTETLEECAKRVLKRETNLSNIYLEQLYTFDDTYRAIYDYIEGFYNPIRIHSSIGYLSPDDFESNIKNH